MMLMMKMEDLGMEYPPPPLKQVSLIFLQNNHTQYKHTNMSLLYISVALATYMFLYPDQISISFSFPTIHDSWMNLAILLK